MGKIRITGMNSGLDTDAMVRELVSAYEKQGEKYTKAKTKTEWKQEAWMTLNGKIKNFFSKQASNMRFSSAYSKKKTTVSDSSKASVIASSGAVNGTQTLKVKELARAGYLTGGEVKIRTGGTEEKPEYEKATKDTTLRELGYDIAPSAENKITIGIGKSGSSSYKEYSIEVDGDTTLGGLAKLISEKEGITASFDDSTGRFFVNSDKSGEDFDFAFKSTGVGVQIQETLKLIDHDKAAEGGAKKIDASDAKIELNGVDFTSSSNNFSINGLTITAKAASDEVLSLVTDTDYDEIYDNIKNFFKEYNSLMNEMDKLYNAKSSKGYEPLTKDEKEAMTEDEIKQWEAKIKDSLLKSDSELDTIASAMRNAMLSTFDIGGKTYSLSSFGINTLGYFNAADNEKNAYHIDGNKDDPETSGNEDRLRAMIASNPEATATFFQSLSQNLYDAMNKIQSTSDSYTSYGNFFSDKKLQNEYVDKQKQVDKWEKYVADQEDKYYRQFTAMESAMSSLNSQQSYISQLFAG
jgi:flagellar hook-associated protein 2